MLAAGGWCGYRRVHHQNTRDAIRSEVVASCEILPLHSVQVAETKAGKADSSGNSTSGSRSSSSSIGKNDKAAVAWEQQ